MLPRAQGNGAAMLADPDAFMVRDCPILPNEPTSKETDKQTNKSHIHPNPAPRALRDILSPAPEHTCALLKPRPPTVCVVYCG